MIVVILCGGSGSRLFPLSRPNQPKQFLDLDGSGRSMLQNTIVRIQSLDLSASSRILLLCNPSFRFLVEMQVQQLHPKPLHPIDILYEPESRNTGPAIGLVLQQYRNTEEHLLILPSDHLYHADFFEKTLPQAFTCQHPIVLFAITPTYPETGYGYIEVDEGKIVSFREKPSTDKANEFLAQKGRYFWNSGIFLFSTKPCYELFVEHNPQIMECITNDRFGECPSISIDYALLEKVAPDTMTCVLYGGEWKDIGSYSSLQSYTQPHHSIQSRNNYVHSSKPTILHYIKNTIVVETEDLIFVSSMDHAQDIKSILHEYPDIPATNQKIGYRPWGMYTIIREEPQYKSKQITVYTGHRLSLQSHAHRSEHWICISGEGETEIDDVKRPFRANDQCFIPCHAKHRVRNTHSTDPLIFVEVQTGSYFGEDDIIRYEDDYSRC